VSKAETQAGKIELVYGTNNTTIQADNLDDYISSNRGEKSYLEAFMSED
jgi:hypothetical protein